MAMRTTTELGRVRGPATGITEGGGGRVDSPRHLKRTRTAERADGVRRVEELRVGDLPAIGHARHKRVEAVDVLAVHRGEVAQLATAHHGDVVGHHGRGADEPLAVLLGGCGEHATGERILSDGLGNGGMYIGNNQYIDAPHTGDVVKIMSLVRPMASALGAIRPEAALLATPTCSMVMRIWK